MTLLVRFGLEAEAELDDTVRWYERRSPGVGLALLSAVDAVSARIVRWPEAGTPEPDIETDRVVRRMPLRRFPYRVVWVVTDDEVYVVAVAHNHRRPGYWRHRLEGG